MSENPITTCAAADKAAIDAFSSTETSDLTAMVTAVVREKINATSAAMRINLITCPNAFLDGADGLIIKLLMEKAKPVYNTLYNAGLVWIVAKIIPIATKHTAPLHIYLGLDKVKLLSLDPAFMEQLQAGSDVAVNRIVECFLPRPRNPISPENVYGSTRKQQGGKRGRKTPKHRKNLYKK